MNQIPLLFLGDNPAIPGGLSKIGRDLSILAAGMDEFRVGFLGRGGLPSSRLPFMQYPFPEYDQWGEGWLQDVWTDFSKGERGVVMTIWDPSRLMWLGNPIGMPNEEWLRNPPFELWGYFPIDAEGPYGSLSTLSREALRGFKRVLAYGMFGSSVLSTTLRTPEAIPFLPHGLNMDKFQYREGEGVKVGMGIDPTTKLVGVVMTNQERKDWGLAFDTISRVKAMTNNVRFWCKTDSIDRYWDLRALTADFNVGGVVTIELSYLSDLSMGYMYSACDCTFLPSLGEGFGYPIVESLACGTPCIHGNYAGGAELIPNPGWLIDPITFRYDTRHNCKRPVFNPQDFADAIVRVLDGGSKPVDLCTGSVEYLDWKTLKEEWVKWFKEGVRGDN